MKDSFHKFAELCNKLEELSSNISMRKKLEDYFKKIPKNSIKYSSYFLLGNVKPKYQSNDLGIGSKLMIKAISESFNKKEKEVQKMFNKKGDLGDVIKELNDKKKSSLSLKKVNKELIKVQNFSGKESQDKKIKQIGKILKEADSLEAKYIARIALGTLRVGAGDKTIIEAFAVAFTKDKKNKEKIEDAYNICTDLGFLGESLAKNGLKSVKKFHISLGRPIQSMLAQRVDKASEIMEKIEGNYLAAEHKYDGERVQIHKNKNEIQLFSRRLEDISSQYPELIEYIKKYIKIEKTVIDGEIIPYKKGKMLSFQKLMQRRRKYDVKEYREKIPVVVFVFDVLYINGKSMIKKSYPERRKELEKVIDSKSKKVQLAERKTSKKFEDIKKFFEKAVKKGLEGVIVKSTSEDSVYQPGKRGWKWIKWKKEYAEGMQESFDVVVLGSYYGRGKRKEYFGALLGGVYNKEKDRFESFTKIGAGFSEKDLENIKKKLKKYKIKDKENNVKIKKEMEPDIYYQPKLVIEVIGAEITRSPTHAVSEKNGKGLALRFPRFQSIREDKSPKNATKVKEIKELK